GWIPTTPPTEVKDPLKERTSRSRIASSEVVAPGRSNIVEVLLDDSQRARLVAPNELAEALLHKPGVKGRMRLAHLRVEPGILSQLRLAVLVQQLVEAIAPG